MSRDKLEYRVGPPDEWNLTARRKSVISIALPLSHYRLLGSVPGFREYYPSDRKTAQLQG